MQDFSVHHNLFAHNHHRNPLLKVKTVEMINNIIYGWVQYATQIGGGTIIDIINNKFAAQTGLTATNRREFIWKPHDPDNARPPATGPDGNPSIYFTGNIGPRNSDPDADAWDLMIERAAITDWGYAEGHITDLTRTYRRFTRRATPHPVIIHDTTELDDVLLPDIGASKRLDDNGYLTDNRGSIDQRVINDYLNRSGVIPTTVTDTDYPAISAGTPYADSDHDGMSDKWETAYGLNPNDPSDRNSTNLSTEGYMNLELFLSGTMPVTDNSNKIRELLKDAASSTNTNVQYIVTGDSTRDNSFNRMISYYTEQFDKINVELIDNACSSQSCYKWMTHTGSFDTYLSDAITSTKGNGENTIMEFSFGLNEVEPPDIKETLLNGITQYTNARPQATVFLAIPVTTSATSFNTQLKNIYHEIALERHLMLVDTTIATVDVHGNPDYYEDRTHPNQWGSRRIVNYITDQILPPELYSIMTLAEAPTQSGWMSIDDINTGLNIRLEKEAEITEIGIKSILSSVTTNPPARACGHFTVLKNGVVDSINIYHNGDNDNNYTLQVAVYTDNGGMPQNRIGTSSIVQVNNNEGWQKVTLQAGANVNAGQKIWLAWKFSVNPGMHFSYEEGIPMRYDEQNNSLESTYVTGKSSAAEYSIYATILSTHTYPTGCVLWLGQR